MSRLHWLLVFALSVSTVAAAMPPPLSVARRAEASELVVRGRPGKVHVVRVSEAVSYAVVEVAVKDTWKAGVAPGIHPKGDVVIAVVTTEARAEKVLTPDADLLLFLRGVGPYLFAEIFDGGFESVSDAALQALGPPRKR